MKKNINSSNLVETCPWGHQPGQFTQISMGLITYSCGRILGHYEPVHVKLVCEGFHHVLLKYSHESAVTQKWKFDNVTLRYAIPQFLNSRTRIFGKVQYLYLSKLCMINIYENHLCYLGLKYSNCHIFFKISSWGIVNAILQLWFVQGYVSLLRAYGIVHIQEFQIME